MKKLINYLLPLLIVPFCSCSNGITYKVTLTGSHCHWEKSEDQAKRGYDYTAKAICDRGYALVNGDIVVEIDGRDMTQLSHFNEETNVLTIDGSAVSGDIVITATADYGIYTCSFIVPNEYYQSPKSREFEINIDPYTPNIDELVTPIEGYLPPKKEDIIVTEGINFTYAQIDGSYHFTINHSEFYKDIAVTFPALEKSK